MLKSKIQESHLVGCRWHKEAQFWSGPKVEKAELLEKWDRNPWIPGVQEERNQLTEDPLRVDN